MMKRTLSIAAASAVCAVCFTGTAFAAVDASALNDGVYSVDVTSDSKMFKVENCDITVADGKITAAVTLSGTGYGKLFVGTGEQAAAAAESDCAAFKENAESKYVYTIVIPSLDEEIAVSAWSTKKSEWYERKLTFKSDKLPESAFKAASDPILIAPAPTDSEPLLIAPAPADTNKDPEKAPDTGVMGTVGITVAAAAVAVVFSRKKRS